MWAKHKQQSGFTIVELLIVIVVIAILAAISIVAYNGIQNRTYDSSIQNDLRQTYNKIQLYRVDNSGSNPPATSNTDVNSVFSVNRRSYASGTNSLIYCYSDTNFAIVARSKSGNGYYYSSVSGANKFTTWPGDSNLDLCPAAGIVQASAGYSARWIYVNGAWEPWFTPGA